MKFRPRLLQPVLRRALREFPIVALVGLRQSGKSTLVERLEPGRPYVTLDDLGILSAARSDPQGFLAGLPRPVAIDEIQRVPELVVAIKREVDRRRRPGEFLLTGSAAVQTRHGVQETLAGRAALLRLRPMTWSEAAGRADWNPVDALFSCRSAAAALSRFGRSTPFDAPRLLAGGLPEPLLRRRGASRSRWFEQYRSAYVERDVPPLLRVEEVSTFVRFLSLAAARTAQTTNLAALAHDVGISADTGIRWSGLLEATFLLELVPPWFRNIGKRLVKAPKLHGGDVGLTAHLAGIQNWKDAQRQNIAGPLLESLVAQHLSVFASASRLPTRLFHYRTHAGAEVDFVTARVRSLLPIEIKLTATPDARDLGGLRAFMKDFAAPFGVLLYAGTESIPLGRSIVALPLTTFLEGSPR